MRDVLSEPVNGGTDGAGESLGPEPGVILGGEPGKPLKAKSKAKARAKADAHGGFAPSAGELLRNTQEIQYKLSEMADQKASMLLGITFVIFTIAVGQARSVSPQVPLLVLGGAAFVAAVLTVFAVMPTTRPPPLRHGSQNLLFFGVFSQMPQDEYVEELLGELKDTRATYEIFARDIYQNGRVLAGKKYLLLGYAYRVLLLGLVSSATTFVVPLLAKVLGY